MPVREIKYAAASVIGKLYRNDYVDKSSLYQIRMAKSIDTLRYQPALSVILGSIEQEYYSKNGDPSKAEKAVYGAVRLFSLAQQSRKSEAFRFTSKEKDTDIFTVLGMARASEDVRLRLDRVVGMVLKQTDINATLEFLVRAIKILKSCDNNLEIDFAQLAGDLYSMQFGYKAARRIHLLWAQKYYRNYYKKEEEL